MTFKITSGPVSNDDALKYATELETVIGEICGGQRKGSQVPTQPIVALIKFVRDQVSSTGTAVDAAPVRSSRSSDTEELRLTAVHLRRAIEDAERRARNSIKANSADVEDWRADMLMIANDLDARLKV